jgi:hypothetical protein
VGQAVDWVANNIERFGGDPKRIFLSGHSSGTLPLYHDHDTLLLLDFKRFEESHHSDWFA